METRRFRNAVLFSYLQEVTVIALCIMMLPLFCFGTVGFAGNENVAIQSAVAPAASVQAGEKIGSGDGRIHVIPSLSSPSVKNGGRLKIQAVVKAVEGVERVEAVIERAGGEAAKPVATIALQPAPVNLGGVSADLPGRQAGATVGLWQAEWDANGLNEGYYTVALTVTDSTGHVFTDRSLRFSDPIAGNNTPGSAAYPNDGLLRLDAMTFNAGENSLWSAVIDPSAGYAYFGTYTIPGRVVKVALGSGSNPPTRVGVLTLDPGEDGLNNAVIDPSAGYAYFGTFTSPGRVVKIDLSDFSRVGALTLNSGEDNLQSAVIDPSAGYAYFGTFSTYGRVVKVALGSGSNPPTRVGAVTLNWGEDDLQNAVIDPSAGYAYFGTFTWPGRVVKVALGSGGAAPTRVGAVTLNSGENYLISAVIDPSAGYAYFGTNTSPGRVVKVALGSGGAAPTRVGAVTLNAGENYLYSAVIDPSAGYAYFGTGMNPSRVVKVALGSSSNPPTRVGAATLPANAGEDGLHSAVIDPSAGYAYFGTNASPGRVVHIGLSHKGIVKATKFTMPEEGSVTSVHFYSHESTGTVRLALYDEGTTKTLLWQSGQINNTATNDFLDSPISAGTPTSLNLLAGTYWLAWQVDTMAEVPSYTQGASGDGFFSPQSYGAFPAEIGSAALTTTDEVWTEYITYAATTPTPTPTPTPWQIVFDFLPDREEWTSGSAPVVFSEPDFEWEPDYLKITSLTNTNTFGFWQSPQDAVPADADYLYRARFTVSTDITDQLIVPQIRLRANSLNLQQYDVLSIESAGDGGASPEPSGTDYDLYFVPPANDTAAMLAFDLLNFNPDDAAAAELSLDTVTVDRFALDSLSTPTVVQDYTFELSQDGWTTGGAPIAFSSPQYIYSSGALELRAITNTNTFGFWGNHPADITIEADKLYRGTFEIRTDLTNPALVPEMRLRYNTGNLQASHSFGISSAGDGANSPGITNTTYDRLYFLPPANCVGEDLLISFDILNFNPGDASTASLILDRAIIETLSPPASP